MSGHHSCNLAKGFSLGEKIFAQLSFNVFWLTGFIAIWQDNVYGALAYAGIVFYGVFGVVVRHLACPRCPHLYQYGDCLQAPPALSKWLVKKPTAHPMSKMQKALFLIVFLTVTFFPQYWLWGKPYYFAVFWVFCGAWYAGQLWHFCKHCRVSSCPLNRSGVTA